MLAVGIDTSGLTHAGSVVAAQALLQLNGALMIDILTAGGDPDPAVARAPLHLGQALIGGTSSSSSAPPSAHALLGLFPGTHRALVGLPGDHRRMAREFEDLNREFRAHVQAAGESLGAAQGRLPVPYAAWTARAMTSAARVQSPRLVVRNTSGAMVTRGTEGAVVVTEVVVVSVACIIDT